MALHVNSAAAKFYALGFEAQPLLNRRIPAQFDFSSCAKHAVPGESECGTQCSHDLAGCSRMARCASDSTISGNLATWNFADGGDDSSLQANRTHSAIHPARISHNDATDTSSQRTTSCNSGR